MKPTSCRKVLHRRQGQSGLRQHRVSAQEHPIRKYHKSYHAQIKFLQYPLITIYIFWKTLPHLPPSPLNLNIIYNFLSPLRIIRQTRVHLETLQIAILACSYKILKMLTILLKTTLVKLVLENCVYNTKNWKRTPTLFLRMFCT